MNLEDAIRSALAKARREEEEVDILKEGKGYVVESFVAHRTKAEGRDRMLVRVGPRDTEQVIRDHLDDQVTLKWTKRSPLVFTTAIVLKVEFDNGWGEKRTDYRRYEFRVDGRANLGGGWQVQIKEPHLNWARIDHLGFARAAADHPGFDSLSKAQQYAHDYVIAMKKQNMVWPTVPSRKK